MNVLSRLPEATERLLFRGKRTRVTTAASYIILNIVLIPGLFYILLNTIAYDWTGSMYRSGFHLNTPLDNAIPFAPAWVIFYLYLFYPLAALTMLYFAFIEYRRGFGLGFALVLINLVAEIVYVIFPVTTDIYRAQLLSHPLVGNAFATAMYHEYSTDPSFNCFPSLHAAVSVICFYAWYRLAREKRRPLFTTIAVVTGVVAIGVMLSTLFVKQHYIADQVAGLLLAWGAGAWAFGKRGVVT